MTTNQTIDGVPRADLESICEHFEFGRHWHAMEGVKKLRALLDASGWDGEVLPPVDTVCDFSTNFGRTMHQGRVLFADENSILMSGHTLIDLSKPGHGLRPILTHEQPAPVAVPARKPVTGTMEQKRLANEWNACLDASAAQPQGEPVAYDQAKENKLFEDWAHTQSDVSLRLCDIGLYYKRDTGLAHDAWQYRAKLAEQPAPVAVVLPARIAGDHLNEMAQGWNACVSESEHLNKSQT